MAISPEQDKKEKQFDAVDAVRKELRACDRAIMRGNRTDAFAAAERAQHAAFDLKQLFAIEL